MDGRVREGRLNHATLSMPLCNVFFCLHVWPVVCEHNLSVKFGYRRKVRGTASFYSHCWFQFTSLDLVTSAFGGKAVSPKQWGDQPVFPLPPVAEDVWWNGGKLELVVNSSVPLTVHVHFLTFYYIDS